MADLTFSVHPLDLANALFNAVEVSKDAGGRPGCPHILIHYGPDEDWQAALWQRIAADMQVAGQHPFELLVQQLASGDAAGAGSRRRLVFPWLQRRAACDGSDWRRR